MVQQCIRPLLRLARGPFGKLVRTPKGYLFAKGRASYQEGRYRAAIRWLTWHRLAYRRNLITRLYIARAHRELGDLGTSYRIVQRALGRDPAWAPGVRHAIDAALRLGWIEEAVSVLDNAGPLPEWRDEDLAAVGRASRRTSPRISAAITEEQRRRREESSGASDSARDTIGSGQHHVGSDHQVRDIAKPRDPQDYLSSLIAATEHLAGPDRTEFVDSHFAWPGYPGAVLAYTPVARQNGFQELLYSQAWEHGYAPVGVSDPFDLEKLPWPGPMACHFHWLGGLTESCDTRSAADDQVERFARLLDTLKLQHRKLIWTVHNILPHDTKWPEHDVRIRKNLVEACDAIHIMSSNTRDLVADYFPLPESKLIHAPHPSYEGVYPMNMPIAEARARLGISPDAHVFLMFGAVSPYKGYEALCHAFERLADEQHDHSPLLLVAGQEQNVGISRRVKAWSAQRTDVICHIRTISHQFVPIYFRAADVAVCPYTAALNSGAALLALTFGVPVIGPSVGGFLENLGEGCAWLYDQGDQDQLYDAMLRSLDEPARAEKADQARLRRRELGAAEVSQQFFRALDEQLSCAEHEVFSGASSGAHPVHRATDQRHL